MKGTNTLLALIILLCSAFGCAEFIEVDPPRTNLVRTTVFLDDKTATAAMLDLYSDMEFGGFASGNALNGFSLLGSFSSDEWVNSNDATSEFQQFSDNELTFRNTLVARCWTDLYRYIYKSNAIIEGVGKSETMSAGARDQLEGEAQFMRAFSYFYLVNLWGDVPLVHTTDYRVNTLAGRTPVSEVYEQIIADLDAAISLLADDYALSQNERVRINRWAAIALLSRVHLYRQEWAESESYATEIIGHNALYSLEADVKNVFIKNSKEAIWQLHSVTPPRDLFTFLINTAPVHGELRAELLSAIDDNDTRFINWISSATNGIDTFYYSSKYKSAASVAEYSTVMRLSEQYLIRAEARARLDNLSGAKEDLNKIRNRANLGNSTAITKDEVLADIMKQRQLELFTEWGHRWLDLKRTGTIDDVLPAVKGSRWQSTDALYPIPEVQMLNDVNMLNSQNPGY